MKKVVFSFFLLFSIVMSYAAEPDSTGTRNNNFSEPIDRENCTCKGIPLYGRVKVVSALADFDVKVVNSLSDLDVKIDNLPTNCGEWEFVDSLEDFTIRYVDALEDFSIRFVNALPGVR